ncbi:MAG: OPT/YSL family transporter [Candidatus Korarchaeota archaeon]|nr:OPT/YSL family transporter [Candidatus Korarchaeota archaeon]
MEECSPAGGAFTFRSITLSLAFGLFMLFAQTVMRSAAGYSWTGEAALVVLTVAYALSTVRGNPLSIGEMGVIFGSIEVITVLFVGWQYILPSWARAGLAKDFPLRGILPEFLVPKDQEALRALLLGGGVNWSAWILPLTYAVLFAVVLSLFSYLNIIPFRRFYLEKEKLIFPVATVSAKFSQLVKDRGEGLRWLWLGVLAGFGISLFQKGHLLQAIWEDFPAAELRIDLTPWLQQFFPGGAFGMDPGTQITPDLLAWAFLIPLEIQVSMWATAIVAFLLVPPVLVRMGLLPYEPGHDFAFYSSNAAVNGPLPWYHISTGLYLAVGLIPLILGYRYIRDSWRAWEDEPLKRKWLVIGWLLTFAASTLMIMLLGVSPLIALALVILHLMYWHGYVWTIGMGNWIIPVDLGIRGIVDNAFFASGMFQRASSDAFFSGASSAMMTDTVSAQPTASVESFKYAKSIGMRAREMFRAQLMGLLFGAVVGGVLLLVSFHAWGAAKKPLDMASPIYPNVGLLSVMGDLAGWKPEYFLEGLAIGAIVFLLRGGVPWLGISAVGVLFGLLIPQYAILYMISSLLRYLTRRYGGQEFFWETAVPFVAGFAIGGVLNIMGTSLVVIMRSSPLEPLASIVGVIILLSVILPSVKAYMSFSQERIEWKGSEGEEAGEVIEWP